MIYQSETVLRGRQFPHCQLGLPRYFSFPSALHRHAIFIGPAQADTPAKSDPTEVPPEASKVAGTDASPLEAAGKTEEVQKEAPVEEKGKDKGKLDAVIITCCVY